MKLKQLYDKTNDDRKFNAQFVKILQIKQGHTAKGLAYVAAQTYSTKVRLANGDIVVNSSPSKYVTMITFVSRKLDVHVACSCNDNAFRWETSNSYKNAAEIEYSNGAPPDITNSAYRPGLCKHTVSLYLRIKPKLPS